MHTCVRCPVLLRQRQHLLLRTSAATIYSTVANLDSMHALTTERAASLASIAFSAAALSLFSSFSLETTVWIVGSAVAVSCAAIFSLPSHRAEVRTQKFLSVPSLGRSRAQTLSLQRNLLVSNAEADDDAEAGGWAGAAAVSGLTSGVETVFSLEDINGILPHRYPFLLVDKVIEYEQGQRAVGVKSVTLNEPQFTGHFPGRPIMPGVMQIEALAQLAGIVCLQMEGASPGAVFFFAGVDGVKWKRPVVPGDQLVMEVEIKMWKPKFGLAKASGRAYVDGNLAVEVKEMTFALAK